MACEPFRELISARLDGETTPAELAGLDEHLQTCVACRAYASRVGELQRPLRMDLIGAVPDMADQLLSTLPAVRRPLRLDLMRVILAAIALTQLVFAVPELFAVESSEPVHMAHHLGSWDLAFAIGLLVVAWLPNRARGLLPMAAALAGAMVVTAVIDVDGGHAAGLTEASHVLEIAGVLLVWALARSLPPEIGPKKSSRSRLPFPLPARHRNGRPAFDGRSGPTGVVRAKAQPTSEERAA